MFKAALRKLWVRHRSKALVQRVDMKDWVSIISGAIMEVLPANGWRSAFKHVGLLDRQRNLGDAVRQKLSIEGRIEVASTKPTDEELRVLFPGNVKVQSLSLFPAAAAPKAKAASKAKAVAKPKAVSKAAPAPISFFTRSKVKL